MGYYDFFGTDCQPCTFGFKRHANGVFEYPIRRSDTGKPVLSAMPSGINDYGMIIGTYTATSGRRNGFIIQNGQFTGLDLFPGGDTDLLAINNRGDFVGWGFTPGAYHHFAVIDGMFSLLDPLGVQAIAWDRTMVGCWEDGNPFVRGPKGNYFRFRVAGSTAGRPSACLTGVNNAAGKWWVGTGTITTMTGGTPLSGIICLFLR